MLLKKWLKKYHWFVWTISVLYSLFKLKKSAEKMLLKKWLKKYHWFVWTISVLYSLFKLKKSAEKHFFSLSYSDFDDGWAVINRPKDVSDFEWTVLTSAFKKYWPMLFFQVIFSKLLHRIVKSALPLFYSCYSIICLTVILGDKATLCFLFYIIIMFAAQMLGRKSICYFLTLCALLFKNSSVSEIKSSFIKGESESFLFDIALTWIMAKSLSFMCDRINLGIHKRITLHDFSVIISYCLYLPAVFTGPILSYDFFVIQMEQPISSSSLRVTIQKVKRFCYIVLLYTLYEIMLHFLYSSCIQYYPDVAQEFDSWSWCGLGYSLSVMFYLKYFIIYSMAGSISSFENIELPPPPKCISCIHLSSYLWRHFDRGLYLWILRYLYHPLMQGRQSISKKLCALAVSFLFVCLWHNIDKAICIWTFLNFILVSSEVFTMAILSSNKLKRYLPSFIHQKKYYAVWTTPHFVMMCISCTFFLSNYEIGVLLFRRMILSGLIPFLPLMMIMFCGCKVSMDVREWEKNHQSYSASFKKVY